MAALVPMSGARLGRWALLAALAGRLAAAQEYQCPQCNVGESFTDMLKPDAVGSEGIPEGPASDVHVVWPTHIEVIPITEDIGGWEPNTFHERLTQEAVRGWRAFRHKIAPDLPKGHPLKHFLSQSHAGALNDGFFHYQKRLFEAEGNLEKALADEDVDMVTPPPDANSSWPDMNALPEYNKLRNIIDKLSRRYLARSGLDRETAQNLNFSIFNWAAVHGRGEFHGPHTHVGEYNVAVFYAQAGPNAGKLRMADPRGHSPPFGQNFFHTPRSGDLLIFPSWLSHMATVTAPTSDMREDPDSKEPFRVVFAFNIGPVGGPLPCHLWWSDPTGNMGFKRRDPIDPVALGL